MIERRPGGRMIAVTSVHEHQPRVGSSAYDAAKHGLGGLMKTSALELGGARHHLQRRGAGGDRHADDRADRRGPAHVKRPGVPLGRPGDAREMAAVIAFLASAESSYVTGASIVVDGGMLQMGPHGGFPSRVRRLAHSLTR